MATVSTTNGTYLTNLFNPQVVADLIDAKLTDKITFAPLATIDNTLVGRAGDTVTLPYYAYIGDATQVAEGTDIPLKKLTQTTRPVQVVKYGVGAQLTDEAVLSGYGDPIGEAANQIVTSIASAVDNQLLAALDANTTTTFAPSGSAALTPADIPLALAKFGEDWDGEKVIIVDADFYAQLVKENWIPASEIAADVRIRGAVGMAYGCQVLLSNRVHAGNYYHIVKPGALAIFMKRDTLVEVDRDIINQSTVITGSKLFAPYLLDATKAIRVTK